MRIPRRWQRLWTASALFVVALIAGAPAAAVESPRVGQAWHAEQQPRWLWPTERPWRITAPFQAPATRYSAGHRGVDLLARQASAIVAPAAGVVRFSGVVVDRPVITLEHAGGVLSSMEPVAGSVPVGTPVHAGQLIGSVAAGGHCSGVCVHLGVRVNGEYVSPLLFLGGMARAVLLPLEG